MSKTKFPFQKKVFIEISPRLMENTKQLLVLPTLIKCHLAIASFDLWMSKGTYDVFALVINFLGKDWQPKHVIINLFKAIKIKGKPWLKV
jgi:hypothetical protein